jgi:hypothetical protein
MFGDSVPRLVVRSIARFAGRGLLVDLPAQIGHAERLGLRLLKRHLAALEHDAAPAGEPGDVPALRLERLLARSVGQSTDGGREELYSLLLAQLVPDEARILAALSDGGSAAVVHVRSRWLRSGVGAPALENVSSVGRAAGVALPQLVPTYVSHLLRLGLVELADEDESLELDYELVMAETIVRDALARANGAAVFPPKVLRQTVRLSDLGRGLWSTSRSDAGSPA